MVSKGGTGSLSLKSLVPRKLLRLFDGKSLMLLVMCKLKPSAGNEVDLSTVKSSEVLKLVQSGSTTKEAGLIHLVSLLEDLSQAGGDVEVNKLKATVLSSQIGILQNLTSSVSPKAGIDGAFLFVLAKLSGAICSANPVAFSICVASDDDDGEQPKHGEGRASGVLRRPFTLEQMFCLLHHFQLICVASGLISLYALSPFLDDVVYEPVRLKNLEWPVAFELLIVYLRMVENDPVSWNISDVVAKSGSMDSKRSEARVEAEKNFPAHIFRSHAGNALAGGPGGYGDKIDVFGDTANAKKGCVVWNAHQTLHDPKHCKGGVCLFAHKCNHWGSNKGYKGQCLENHTADSCTNPNKCAEAVLESKPKRG